MINLPKKSLCTGCSACMSVCGRNAITMKEDRDGFLNPIVNFSQCVECGLCSKICPVLVPFEKDTNAICFAGQSLNSDILHQSSSGGAFTELATKIIQEGGVVFGCVLEERTMKVFHCGVEDVSGLTAMRGSKYIQSDMRNVLREVKLWVLKGRKVLFTGTPCQVAAANRIVGQQSNFITVELICHGVPSQSVFHKYIAELEKRVRAKVIKVKFRDKDFGWREFGMSHYYNSERLNFHDDYKTNDFYSVFFSTHLYRDCCYNCSFRQGASGSDITIGDFWGIEKISTFANSDYGVSAVIVHSKKGLSLVKESKMYLKEVSLLDINRENMNYLHNCSRPSLQELSRFVVRNFSLHRGWCIYLKMRLFLRKLLGK